MSAVDYGEYQRAVRLMEDDTARGLGQPVKRIRALVAREVGVSPGTLEDIRKGRIKSLAGRVERAIDAALMRHLERQKARIEHELVVASARVVAVDCSIVARAEASRDALDALIVEARGRRP